MIDCPICFGPTREFVRVPCTAHPLWTPAIPSTLVWNRCESCGHYVETSDFDRGEILALTDAETPMASVIHSLREKWIPTLAPLAMPGLTVLDFGCGSGVAGFTAQEFDMIPTFVDMKEAVRTKLRDLGAEDVHAGLRELSGRAFDLIILSDVIEHVWQPVGILRELSAFAPRMLLSTPNPAGAVWQGMGGANPYWREIEHYHVFSKQSLDRVLQESGWFMVTRKPNHRFVCGMDVICRRIK